MDTCKAIEVGSEIGYLMELLTLLGPNREAAEGVIARVISEVSNFKLTEPVGAYPANGGNVPSLVQPLDENAPEYLKAASGLPSWDGAKPWSPVSETGPLYPTASQLDVLLANRTPNGGVFVPPSGEWIAGIYEVHDPVVREALTQSHTYKSIYGAGLGRKGLWCRLGIIEDLTGMNFDYIGYKVKLVNVINNFRSCIETGTVALNAQIIEKIEAMGVTELLRATGTEEWALYLTPFLEAAIAKFKAMPVFPTFGHQVISQSGEQT
jgi:hypothetical protein